MLVELREKKETPQVTAGMGEQHELEAQQLGESVKSRYPFSCL